MHPHAPREIKVPDEVKNAAAGIGMNELSATAIGAIDQGPMLDAFTQLAPEIQAEISRLCCLGAIIPLKPKQTN